MSQDELLVIEDDTVEYSTAEPWTVLIVDDEQVVHEVTELALSGFEFCGRPLRFLHAFSDREAREILKETTDIAVMLVDVVMESDHAGLDFVRYVRETAGLKFPRIVLRTGQPGQAPERRVITDYDINDYKQKTELTHEKMFTVMHTSIASYRDLIALDTSRRGLRKVITASARLYELQSMEEFAQGVLEQLAALLYIDNEALVLRADGLAAEKQNGDMAILAGTGRFASLTGKSARSSLAPELFARLASALDRGGWESGTDYFATTYTSATGCRNILYLVGEPKIKAPDRELIELYCQCVAKAQDNLLQITAKLAAAGQTL